MPKDIVNGIERKIFVSEMKLDNNGEGTFEAVFATLNVIDSDDDLTEPGAFGRQEVIVSQYNHGSWGQGEKALPIGVGVISERGEEAIIKGEFDLPDEAAKKTYLKIKYLQEKGRRQEWSYSLPEIDYEIKEIDGRRIRVLKKIRVNEVSPVLMGSGVNTRLLAVKDAKPNGMKLIDHIESVLDGVKEVTERLQAVKDMREEKGGKISPDTVKHMSDLEGALKAAVQKLEQIKQLGSELEAEMLVEQMRYQKLIADRRKICH